MKDPEKQPGYRFARLRLLRATYEVPESPDPQLPPGNSSLDIQFQDRVGFDKGLVRYVQEVQVKGPVVDGRPVMEVFVSVEALFTYSEPVNIPPEEFAEQAAPPMVFPFVREWVYRLTTQAGRLPAILLPPVNLPALKAAKATLKAEAGGVRGAPS